MGCGASTARLAEDLQSYRDEVAELQKQLKESEVNRDELQRRLHKVSSPSSGTGSAGTGDADSTAIAKDRVILQVEESPISGSPLHEGSAVPPELISLPKSTSTADNKFQEEKADVQQEQLTERSEAHIDSVLPQALELKCDLQVTEEVKVEKKNTGKQDFEDAQKKAQEVDDQKEDGTKDAEKTSASDEKVHLPGAVVHEGESCEAPEMVIRKDLAEESDKASTCTPAAKPEVAICSQCFCEAADLYQDPADLQRYCEKCWIEYYGQPPSRNELQPLVGVEVHETWAEELLAQAWSEQILPGWPPPLASGKADSMDSGEEHWVDTKIRIRRDICGPHAREQTTNDRPSSGELLAGRYRVSHVVGEGHFTKAFLAHDLKEDKPVCVKRHRSLSVEALADLYVLDRRMAEVDVGGKSFPKLIDAFYDVAGFTVEALLEGQNCLSKSHSKPNFFQELKSLKIVATGTLSGLALLDQAGIVHNDIKADNLMWTEGDGSSNSSGPHVKIVDFGCARLDQREENGRNWALAEGGAGHLGKWSPEMCLRLPITHRGDVWGIAVALCELYCGRCVWRSEADTAEVVLTQGLGLCNLRDGVPASLLRRSPLDVRVMYSPAPRHWPLRRSGRGQMETLRPSRWGIDQVIGHGWQDTDKVELGQLLLAALVLDPAFRPSASQLLKSCSFAATKSSDSNDDEDDDDVELPAT